MCSSDLVLCRNILPLGRFLQKHFTAGLFSIEILYYWAISYNVLFNHADVSAVGIAHGPLLSIPT